SEEYVILPAEEERFGLTVAQEPLPLGIPLDVGAVIVEKIELDPPGVRSLHEAEVHLPIIGADRLGNPVTVLVDEPDPVEPEEREEGRLRLRASVLPQRMTDAVPRGGES